MLNYLIDYYHLNINILYTYMKLSNIGVKYWFIAFIVLFGLFLYSCLLIVSLNTEPWLGYAWSGELVGLVIIYIIINNKLHL